MQKVLIEKCIKERLKPKFQPNYEIKRMGVESKHTAAYLRDMNKLYSDIFDAAHEIQPA